MSPVTPPTTITSGEHNFFGLSVKAVRPSVLRFPLTQYSRDAISVLSRGISMNFRTDVHRRSGHCWI